ncbi:hypothetical protein DES52_116134 [Deinococcus yavapaiensis KR-236]|uniref:Uncharacterized protein n=1 Tax=Deinococcus yavapaiensis KR-236 TaxID=694435 RepID=A0A318S3P1_9DEIO|nr:hypothetical protein DES52_116134 [Deinococcus yavapaiensis KR-236]
MKGRTLPHRKHTKAKGRHDGVSTYITRLEILDFHPDSQETPEGLFEAFTYLRSTV